MKKWTNAILSILYDTVFSVPIVLDNKCEAVIVDNKSGRSAYKAKYYIDSTGDADLMHRTGVENETNDNWLSYRASCRHGL